MKTRRGKSTLTAVSKVVKAEQRDTGDLEDVLSLAEYEIECDPYRGMNVADSTAASPWFECRHTKQDCGKVSQVCGCACRSLIRWTRDYDSKSKRTNRKQPVHHVHHLGRRREDPTYQCPCDHNPFCLTSLGGVMDDFLAQAATEILQLDDTLADCVETRVHGVDGSSDEYIGCEVIDVDMAEPDKLPNCVLVLHEAKVDDGIQVICSKQTPRTSHRPETMNVNGRNSFTIDMSKTPAEAFLESVTFTAEELDHTNEKSVYSKMTRGQLSAVRREEFIDLNLIRVYAHNIVLKHVDAKWTQKVYLDRLQALHDKLLFPNPLKDNKSLSQVDGKMRFAVPPGMKNLGATCYLNTQLQCLARNTAFLDGIFSWRQSKTSTRMDSVLLSLQQVMSRLAYGAEATSSTEDFSRALGLQNDEMQDPNEFARLLFQRMHEAFQSSQISTNGAQSLATLLPTLFEGDMTYETRCQSCGRVTERSEKFMDINLPIVHPDTANTFLAQLRLPAANKENETTVQYCLDTYMCSEELNGDNKYWCENCATKRDATRQVVFGTLPPLLNLQLCRYVYDRQKQTKKKLTDKVLLPQCLNVRSNQISESVTYRLCAVMKHLGNSAYQGHYIAESMDWQTGIWFEFDDEKVSVLENGPSCCPQDADTTERRKRKGSRDAYNMYYVQESFLGRCAVNSVVDRRTEQGSETISQLESERQALYDTLSMMCRHDAKLTEQGWRRKRGLLTLLYRSFHSNPSCVEFGPWTMEHVSKESVWVDGAGLRSMFQCLPQMGEDLVHLLLRKDLTCQHKTGVEPRVARCGKLVPRVFYEELLGLIEVEQLFLGSCSPASSFNDCFQFPNVACNQCAESYKLDLQRKLELVTSLQGLFHKLDPNIEGKPAEADSSDYVYAVSKRFVTKFRKAIVALFKKLATFDATPGGLDDLEDLQVWNSSILGDEIDITVNSAIVCESRKCCSVNKRHVRYVSESLWSSIHHLFPKAIQIKKQKAQEMVWIRCTECEGSDKERSSIDNWATCITDRIAVQIMKGQRKLEHLFPSTSLTESEDYFLVHRKDIERLWESFKLITSNHWFDVASLKHELEKKWFGLHSTAGERDDFYLHEKILRKWLPVSLLCPAHQLVLNPLVLTYSLSQDGDSTIHWHFSDHVELLSAKEYRHYLFVVCRLYEMVFSTDVPSSSHFGDTESTIDAIEAALASSCHPRVRPQAANTNGGDSSTFLNCSIGNAEIEMRLSPAQCADQTCNSWCIESLAAEKYITNDERRGSEVTKQVQRAVGKVVIQVDDDGDDFVIIDGQVPAESDADAFCLQFVDVEESANIDNILASLGQVESNDPGARRSGRKRKLRYHLGGLKGENLLNLRRHHNLAAVRLHILEKRPNFKLDQPLTLFLPLGRQDKEGCNKITVSIPFNWNTRVLSDIVAAATQNLCLCKDELDKVFDGLVLIQRTPNDNLPRRKLPKTWDDEVQTEVLLESLLQIANLTARAENDNACKKSTRRVERGFRGTFLHSPVSPISDESERFDSDTHKTNGQDSLN